MKVFQDKVEIANYTWTNVEMTNTLIVKNITITSAKSVILFNLSLYDQESNEVKMSYSQNIQSVPAVLSILPPIVAMIFIIFLKDALAGLFMGVFFGSTLLAFYNPLLGFLEVFSVYYVNMWIKLGNAQVIIFGLLLGWDNEQSFFNGNNKLFFLEA